MVRKALPKVGALRRGKTGADQGATSSGSLGTTLDSSAMGSMTTELATSPVGDAADCAALVATLAFGGAGEAAAGVGDGGGG
jgi:hypothetical protein